MKSIVTLVMLAGPFGSTAAWAQGGVHAADRAALVQLKDDYVAAVEARDPSGLQLLLSEDFTAVMVTGREVESFDEVRTYWQYIHGLIGDDGSYAVEVSYEPAVFSAEDHALARGTTQDTVVAGGKTYVFDSHWTAVFVRRDGVWKVLRLHASMDPIDNPFTRAAWTRIGWMAGLGGAVVGLLIGLLGGWRWRAGKSRT